MKNLFLDPSCLKGDRVLVEGEYRHYLGNVRRLRAGSTVGAVIGGSRFELRVAEVGRGTIAFDVLSRRDVRIETAHPIRVYQGLLKAAKMDLVVAKLSELGVGELVPMMTGRSVPDGGLARGRVERWGRLAREGAKVTGGEGLLKVCPPVSLADAARSLGDGKGRPVALLFSTAHGSVHLKKALEGLDLGGDVRFRLFFGPEGGFSEDECGLLRGAGALPVSMGDFVLRSETAAIVGTGFLRLFLSDRRGGLSAS